MKKLSERMRVCKWTCKWIAEVALLEDKFDKACELFERQFEISERHKALATELTEDVLEEGNERLEKALTEARERTARILRELSTVLRLYIHLYGIEGEKYLSDDTKDLLGLGVASRERYQRRTLLRKE